MKMPRTECAGRGWTVRRKRDLPDGGVQPVLSSLPPAGPAVGQDGLRASGGDAELGAQVIHQRVDWRHLHHAVS